jgi:hypothetical protein
MENLQDRLQELALAEVAVAPPQKQVVQTSYRNLGITFAREITDDATKQEAQVAVQTCPRNGEGVLDESDVKTLIIDGPEGYALAGFILNDLKVSDGAYAQDVQEVIGQSIVGMSFAQAAPFIKIYSEDKKEARLAANNNSNGATEES